MLSTLSNYLSMLSQESAILVQNAAGLGFMLRAAEGRTQHQPSTRSILNQNRGLLRQHTKVVMVLNMVLIIMKMMAPCDFLG